MAREADVHGFGSSKIIVGVGGSFAVLMSPQPGEVMSYLKYSSGGSLEIVQAPYGVSYVGASLVPLIGTGYLMGSAETITAYGPARYYLIATGATAIAYSLKGLDSGY